jgi:F420-dependent oxidoreductase-like protein
MQFGGFVPQGWRMDLQGIPVEDQWETMAGVGRRLEAAGYDSLWLFDHFHTTPVKSLEPTYECYTLLTALAGVTSTIRLGQMCTCNSYRPPSMLAKITASLDVISGGRLDLAIGAGWYQEEYLAYGYEYPSDGTRLAQLREAVEIITRMWTEDDVHFEGTHYTLEGAVNRPRPLQQPHPPLWIAGGGEKVTLRLVAEKASYSNLAVTPDDFRRKSEILDAHCEDVGRDPAEIIRSVYLQCVVGDSESEIRAAAERAAEQSRVTTDQWFGARFNAAGTVEQVIEKIQAYRDAGSEYAVVYFPDAAWGDSIERFAADVMPAFA